VNAMSILEVCEDQSNDYRIFYSVTFLSPWRCVQDGRPVEHINIPVAPLPS